MHAPDGTPAARFRETRWQITERQRRWLALMRRRRVRRRQSGERGSFSTSSTDPARATAGSSWSTCPTNGASRSRRGVWWALTPPDASEIKRPGAGHHGLPDGLVASLGRPSAANGKATQPRSHGVPPASQHAKKRPPRRAGVLRPGGMAAREAGREVSVLGASVALHSEGCPPQRAAKHARWPTVPPTPDTRA